MAETKAIVIVGGGLAGDTAAGELRQAGWEGRIVLVSDENVRPYDRPPLSKTALLNEQAEESIFLHDSDWYSEQAIELVLGDSCTAIRRHEQAVLLASGKTISYDKLLIATGSRARRLPAIESCGVPVHYLRNLPDARQLRPELREGRRIVVIGGGVIGMEIAATARQRGCAVTVIEGLDRIMARCLSASVSHFLHQFHQAQGVDIRCATRLAAVQNVPGSVLLEDGSTVEADAIVVGVGAEPNCELARDAGLATANGIVVDRYTRTSDPHIHAAGDVAAFESDDGLHRAEHWRHAIDQAEVAARVMMGHDEIYRENPWLWSDQYDLNIQITGSAQAETEVLRGDPASNAFIAFQLREGAIVGATSINRAKFKRPVATLVEKRARIDAARLADEKEDLKKLAQEPSSSAPPVGHPKGTMPCS